MSFKVGELHFSSSIYFQFACILQVTRFMDNNLTAPSMMKISEADLCFFKNLALNLSVLSSSLRNV